MARPKKLPDYIQKAILCGPVPPVRNWKTLPIEKLTLGERVLRFAFEHLRFGEGPKQGKPVDLALWQQVAILSAFDEKTAHISRAILSVGRRSGKSMVIAVILLAYLVGPLAKSNTVIASAAMTRDQAGLMFRLMKLTLDASPNLNGLYKSVESYKKIYGLRKGTEYRALSRDASSNLGVAFYALCIDEAGQINAPNDDFLDAILSSMGTYEDSKVFIISTQAPSDASFLSLQIDTAARERPKNVVCHVYTAETDDLMDEKNWYDANPALYEGYRSKKDIQRNAEEAMLIPAKQNGFLNLFLNRRVSLQTLWLAPTVWKDNDGKPDWNVFRRNGVHLGLDLSLKNDLTVACMAGADDDGNVHVHPFGFTPAVGIAERAKRDRVPYDQWAKDGYLHTVPGATVDYDWVAEFIRVNIMENGIPIHSVQFDRWRIEEFQAACKRQGADGLTFEPVGQGYLGQSPRIEAMETAMLQGKIRHGSHPLLNLGAASAIVDADPSGNRKLTKLKSANKIDAIVAMVMAVYPPISQINAPKQFDELAWIG